MIFPLNLDPIIRLIKEGNSYTWIETSKSRCKFFKGNPQQYFSQIYTCIVGVLQRHKIRDHGNVNIANNETTTVICDVWEVGKQEETTCKPWQVLSMRSTDDLYFQGKPLQQNS